MEAGGSPRAKSAAMSPVVTAYVSPVVTANVSPVVTANVSGGLPAREERGWEGGGR